MNWCPVPTPRDWVPPVRAHAPHGPCGRQCLCSWGFCRAAWTPGGGCGTSAPGALWAEEPGRLGLRPPEEMGRYTGAQGAASLEPLQAYELSPLLWPLTSTGPHLQGLKAELYWTLGPFLGVRAIFHQCSALTPSVFPGPAYLGLLEARPSPK